MIDEGAIHRRCDSERQNMRHTSLMLSGQDLQFVALKVPSLKLVTALTEIDHDAICHELHLPDFHN